ncbi:metallophosphoesterase [Rhizobium sp. MHM7A]|uniref:metallophosphoesterase n=1 Tax=Rhizobium sp. MHM7A TaxID=2583233 RepID=UPI001485ED47|nr:metallophosphoesterase [Rhizobium sp. MHM7A]
MESRPPQNQSGARQILNRPAILYAIPDIHGRADLLKAALDFIRADAGYYGSRPVIYFLGDIVDRGMRSKEAMELVKETLARHPDSIFHIGNHDWWFMDAVLDRDVDAEFIDAWKKYGGLQTLQSYCGNVPDRKAFNEIRYHHRDHIELIEQGSLVTTHSKFVFAHAGLDFSKPLREQTVNDLTMVQKGFLDVVSNKAPVVIHGHTTFRGGPVVTENRISLDTGAWSTNRLVCCRIHPEKKEISFFETIGSQTMTETQECEAIIENRGLGSIFDRLDELFENFSVEDRVSRKGHFG